MTSIQPLWLPLREAARFFPSAPPPKLLKQWSRHGRGPSKRKVFLKLTRSGSRLGIWDYDARDFQERLNAAWRQPEVNMPTAREEKRRKKRVREILASAGFKGY